MLILPPALAVRVGVLSTRLLPPPAAISKVPPAALTELSVVTLFCSDKVPALTVTLPLKLLAVAPLSTRRPPPALVSRLGPGTPPASAAEELPGDGDVVIVGVEARPAAAALGEKDLPVGADRGVAVESEDRAAARAFGESHVDRRRSRDGAQRRVAGDGQRAGIDDS